MIFQSLCTSFKLELLQAVHDFVNDTFYLALYTEDADLDEETTVYDATNEVTGTGYVAGGAALTVVAPSVDGVVAIADFEDLTFAALTVAGISGGLIYNSSKANRAVAVLSFGRIINKTAEDFLITFPAADAESAIIRIKS